jgi:mono/diheme cytochrome c family protein
VKAAICTGLMGLALLAGCRGEPSREPPVHLNPNMDTQDRYNPYGPSTMFADGKVMQEPPEGTVAWGDRTFVKNDGLLKDDDAKYRGRTAEGEYVTRFPESVPVTADLLKRGQERFNIYCSPCHDRAGEGKGIVAVRGEGQGFVQPPSFHQDRIRQMPVGQIYETIRNGVRNMPSYRHQIPVEDRWAIVAYVRALQRSQYASAQDVGGAAGEGAQ